jgi:drug/metabolite transporter (DMT)-like permease
MMRKSWLPAYLALGTVWGCSFIFIELGLEFLTPFGVTFIRCALGAITLIIIARIRKINLPTDRKVWQKLWVVALLLNVIPGVLFAFAQQYVTSVFASIINAATPLMTLVFILVIFREEKLKREQIYGLLIGALGVMTVVGVWKELGDNQLVGVIALLIAVSCYGASYPYSTRNVIPLKLKPEALAAGQLIMAAITLLPLFLINGISNNSYPRQSVIAMLCLGIFGSGFAYIWNFSITAAAGSAIASSVTYLTPVVAVIVGRLYLGEVIVWHEIVGAIIVILGALLSQGRLNRLVKTK